MGHETPDEAWRRWLSNVALWFSQPCKITALLCLRLGIDASNLLKELDDRRCAPVNTHRLDDLLCQSLEIDLSGDY